MNIIGFGGTYGDYVGSNQGHSDWIVAKFDPSGKRLWKKQIGTENHDLASVGGVVVDSNDNIYIFGYVKSIAIKIMVNVLFRRNTRVII